MTVRDLNHHKMVLAVKNKDMAESFQDLYKDTFQASNKSEQILRYWYNDLTEAIQTICSQFSQFLVLPAEKIRNPSLPCSAKDDFAFVVT